jgi:hypothetical protein
VSPEIGVDDPLVVLNVFGRPFSEQLAVRQAVDAFGEIHDHAHVVLNDEQRDAELLVGAFQAVNEAWG